MILQQLIILGKASRAWLERLGRAYILFAYMVWGIPSIFRRFHLFIQQVYFLGVFSFLLILIAGFFVGMVMGFQGYHTLAKFGAESSLGVVVALSIVRELGPVITALLFAGRAGSALTAEIGLMKVTEQLASMEMMAVDPVKQVLVPRLLAGIFVLPLLAAIFSAVGILGGEFVGVAVLGVDSGAYWSQMQSSVDIYNDILNGIVKSIFFGLITTWIAVFEGYDTVPTSEGVSRATTRTVVYSALSVLALDFILTALMFGEH